ncbi:hypothetical protein LAZ67_5001003 [Cordylochernes scorpioides]|uniref:DNA helicase n=1 Tax=Cordylochernes scorpioides TaxID=51811 RepID=A0ABY6KGE6_9ARAC|nr:hypothetical protein LAZ67_5001003 [Cordylochernes scorpioides]
MFSEGREDVNDEERAGRPSTSTTDEIINEVEKMILANRRITVREVSEDLNISIGSCHSIFINDLGMRRVAAKFVPKLLNCDQKQHRMNIANEMLDSVRDDPNLLKRVITGDEATSIIGYLDNEKIKTYNCENLNVSTENKNNSWTNLIFARDINNAYNIYITDDRYGVQIHHIEENYLTDPIEESKRILDIKVCLPYLVIQNPKLFFIRERKEGQILVYKMKKNLSKEFLVMKDEIGYLSLDSNGELLAVSDSSGKKIQIIKISDKSLVAEFTRGSEDCIITSMEFSPSSKYLCVTSNKQTVHLFAIKDQYLNQKSWIFSGQWSFAKFYTNSETPCIATFSPRHENLVYTVCEDGTFYELLFAENVHVVQAMIIMIPQTQPSWLLKLGNGELTNDLGLDSDTFEIPSEMVCNGDLVKEIYGDKLLPSDFEQYTNKAILCPRNVDVDDINNRVLDILEGDSITYFSSDSIDDATPEDNESYPPVFLNSLNPSGMPLHKLKL